MAHKSHDVRLGEVREEEGIDAIILPTTPFKSIGAQRGDEGKQRLELEDIPSQGSISETKIMRVQLNVPGHRNLISKVMKKIGKQGTRQLRRSYQLGESEKSFLVSGCQRRQQVRSSVDHITRSSMFLGHKAKVMIWNQHHVDHWGKSRDCRNAIELARDPQYAKSRERERCIMENVVD